MPIQEYGFVYLWRDKKHKRYYIGAHWGHVNDGYVCSSPWMTKAYKRRPEDFKRRIIAGGFNDKASMFAKEHQIQQYIRPEELANRYYNLCINRQHWSAGSNAHAIAIKSGLKRRGSKLGPRPQEVKDKISAAKLGVKQSPEHTKNSIIARTGWKHTEETKARMSANMKEQYANGRQPGTPKKERRPLYAPGERQRQLWADPVWAANQRQKLKEGSARRYHK